MLCNIFIGESLVHELWLLDMSVVKQLQAPWQASWWRQVCLWMYSGREPPHV